jgi:hypothetical protein
LAWVALAAPFGEDLCKRRAAFQPVVAFDQGMIHGTPRSSAGSRDAPRMDGRPTARLSVMRIGPGKYQVQRPIPLWLGVIDASVTVKQSRQ